MAFDVVPHASHVPPTLMLLKTHWRKALALHLLVKVAPVSSHDAIKLSCDGRKMVHHIFLPPHIPDMANIALPFLLHWDPYGKSALVKSPGQLAIPYLKAMPLLGPVTLDRSGAPQNWDPQAHMEVITGIATCLACSKNIVHYIKKQI